MDKKNIKNPLCYFINGVKEKLQNNKSLQVAIIGVITALFLFIIGKIPDRYVLLGISIYIAPLNWILIICVVMFVTILLALGFSEVHNVSKTTKKRLVEVYEKGYGWTFKITADLLLLVICINLAVYTASFIKTINTDILSVIIFILYFIFFIFMLEKKGLKLFGEKGE